jgi:hypothetical protein
MGLGEGTREGRTVKNCEGIEWSGEGGRAGGWVDEEGGSQRDEVTREREKKEKKSGDAPADKRSVRASCLPTRCCSSSSSAPQGRSLLDSSEKGKSSSEVGRRGRRKVKHCPPRTRPYGLEK